MKDPEWMREAACVGMDVNLFFHGRGWDIDTKEAKTVCSTCPVKEPCLEYGIREQHGIFGGRSEAERRKMRRQRRRAA